MSDTVQGSFDMPEYRCHKVVRAGNIADIVKNNDDIEDSKYTLHLDFGINTGSPVQVDGDYILKHKPRVGGYYVLYKDGYESFSPPEAFESGYSLIKDENTVGEMAEPQRTNPIMKFFAYGHLPENLKAVSKPYSDMAEHLDGVLPDSAEKSVALRKLLESKDAAVRAAL